MSWRPLHERGHYVYVLRGLGIVFFSVALIGAAACSGTPFRSSAATGPNGQTFTYRFDPPTQQRTDMEKVREIIASRLGALGFADAAVDLDPGRQTLTIRFAATRPPSSDAVKLMTQTAELRFRVVTGTIPYSGAANTCRNGAVITPDGPTLQVILPDKDKVACYLLGPTILTGRNIGNATAAVNTSSEAWQVDVHFKDNDFVTKVARPNVDKQVAIVLDGVVQSAPMIQPGITGQNVTITGNFTSKEAKALAVVLDYGALPWRLEYVSRGSATG
jgi:preprotein translocase subunit SecD